VEEPNYPGGIIFSETATVLEGPPPDGVAYRHESLAEPDRFVGAEALEGTGANAWQQRGATGTGVKVAVFDVGWSGVGLDPSLWSGAQLHDCVDDRSCRRPFDVYWPTDGADQGAHGMACAELVSQVAPDADLHLVRVNGMTAFENAVDWAIREGVHVISMSMSFYNASFYDGTGPFREWADRLAAHDVLLVTSAGNNARSHWTGPYVDPDGDGRMSFDGESSLWTYQEEGRSTWYLNWSQHDRCGSTDLGLRVVDTSSGERVILGQADALQSTGADGCEPVERLRAYVPQEGWYRLEVFANRGRLEGVDVDVLARKGQIYPAQPWGSITEPALHRSVMAVGAVRADGYLVNDLEPFSSWGPTHGGVAKPDIVGPDGLTSSVYGTKGFYGTSASTPVVAGLVALILSEDPEQTPHEAARQLERWAWSSGPSLGGADMGEGAGRARLPQRWDVRSGCGSESSPVWLGFVFLFCVPRRAWPRAGG
jgi:subtilisin family serine protease